MKMPMLFQNMAISEKNECKALDILIRSGVCVDRGGGSERERRGREGGREGGKTGRKREREREREGEKIYMI